jgi:hypothetical protein
MLSEDIINSIGGAEDHRGCCISGQNCFALCCNTSMPSQQVIYDRMIENHNNSDAVRFLPSPPRIRSVKSQRSISLNQSNGEIRFDCCNFEEVDLKASEVTKSYAPLRSNSQKL